jgi:D-sedoheptulose 7-phosphate isomerase
MIDKFLNDVKTIAEKLKIQDTEILRIVEILKETKKNEKKVFIIGNGGSFSTSTHMACDLFKIAGIRAISFDNIPLNSAIINDSGWDNLFTDQLERLYDFGDVLIAFSVHGGVGSDKAGAWSQNINKAIEYVKSNYGKTIGFSGFDGGWMKDNCDVCIVVPANSTPLVEAFHVVLHHYIAFELQEGDRK